MNKIIIETTKDKRTIEIQDKAQHWHGATKRYLGYKRGANNAVGLRGWIKSIINLALNKIGYGLVPVGTLSTHENKPSCRFNKWLIPEIFLNEEHHDWYGAPWCHGRDQFEYLVHRGLKPGHKVLDLACGSLRAGIWIIPYLESSNYYGIDSHLLSLEAATLYEIPLHGLEHKKPRFLHSQNFEISHFRMEYDYILAFSLFVHLTDEEKLKALEAIKKSLGTQGRLIVNEEIELEKGELLSEYGIILIHHEEQRLKFIDDTVMWYEYSIL